VLAPSFPHTRESGDAPPYFEIALRDIFMTGIGELADTFATHFIILNYLYDMLS
jgi:hypothetical protein